jgi:copper(I)-binding protein
VNHFLTRVPAVVGAVLVTAALAGCGAGQQSQTATQQPAVNGAMGGASTIALRDVRIRADQTADAVKPGQSADLMFLAANTSGTDADRLVSITSDVGAVTVSPANAEIPAAGSLIVGKPENADAEALQAVSTASKATATVLLSKPIANGLTYTFVFTFQRAGQATVSVPVSAGESAPRAQPSESPEGTH